MLHYDPFLMEDPHFGAIIKEKADEAKAEGEAKGLAEGEAKGLAKGKAEALALFQSALFHIIEARFPTLVASIGKVVWPDSGETFDLLIAKVAIAPDEETVRRLLGLPTN